MSNENEVKEEKKETIIGVTNSQIDGMGNIPEETIDKLIKKQTAITKQKRIDAEAAKKRKGIRPDDKSHKSEGPESGADKERISELEDDLKDAEKTTKDLLKKQGDDFVFEIKALKKKNGEDFGALVQKHKDEIKALKKN